MRTITGRMIADTVKELFITSNRTLPKDAVCLLNKAMDKEGRQPAKAVLKRLCTNLEVAEKLEIPICQDTGMAVVFVEVGREVHLADNLEEAINEGVRKAYTEGFMRCSVVRDPFYHRENTNDNTPAVIYTRIVEGDRIRITAAPKGFGSENMSRLKMFTPSATEEQLIAFVTECVKEAGGNPCPPLLVGIGMGGTFEYAAFLAKKALVRPVSRRNDLKEYAELEEKMLLSINRLGIGAQGFGGDITALAVNIEQYPTHIAGLPVAVNINCHVMRHGEAVI